MDSTRRLLLLLAGLCLAAWLSACTATPAPLTPGEWRAADLLALDPPEAADYSVDLIAAYARHLPEALHLRLDLIDFSSGQDADLYLALDTTPGGAISLPLNGDSALEWDALLVIPASGALQVLGSELQPLPDSALRVSRSPRSHSIAISLTPASLPGAPAALRLEVFSALPGSLEIADRLGPLTPQTAAPQPLPALLAFWDSFPASTPAQALRRWDGAHTGPLGGRHGLYNLLRTARAREIPLALLDLSSPEALAALDYAGGTELLGELAQNRQIALPASFPALLSQAGDQLPLLAASTLADWLAASRASQLAFDLPASPFIYAPLSAAQFPALAEALQSVRHGGAGRTIFTFADETEGSFGQTTRWGAHTLLELPRTPAGLAADRLDIALETRRELAQAAWEWNAGGADPSRFLALGGSLPESPLGSPQYARLAFQYLQDHPWIRLLRPEAMQTLPGEESGVPEQIIDTAGTTVGAGVEAQSLASAALRAIYTQPYPAPPELAALRAGYLGVPGSPGIVRALSEAEAWAANPSLRLDCAADPDRDGAAECILASQSFYALIELDDGRLALALARREGETHLLVAPGYLLASGLGDPASWVPASWDLSAGARADPQALAGAFGGEGGPYSVEILPDGMRLSSADGAAVMEYRLLSEGLAFSYRGPERILRLPLVVDPWRRSAPGWWEGYDFAQEGNTIRWRAGEAEFELESSRAGRLVSFRQGEGLLGAAENPERELPEGMFLPLGMAVVEWEGGELEGWVR